MLGVEPRLTACETDALPAGLSLWPHRAGIWKRKGQGASPGPRVRMLGGTSLPQERLGLPEVSWEHLRVTEVRVLLLILPLGLSLDLFFGDAGS